MVPIVLKMKLGLLGHADLDGQFKDYIHLKLMEHIFMVLKELMEEKLLLQEMNGD